ncbi:MAG: iron chelate uptake ABC transporter family permease subunit, partial [Kiritimatiellae bacterium]|nr:iron chelate uptake ABC transporter family permease subunit [Kiritimatiellia bacterium]
MTYLSDPSMSNRLERLGIRVLQFPCERLADYAPMRARLAALCGLRPRRMLAVVQREPMIVAGKETLPDDVLAEVGCVNAVTNRKSYFVLSPEARVKLAPDGEVDFSMDYDLTRLGPKLPGAIDELRRKLAASGATGETPVAPVERRDAASPSGTVVHALFWLRFWRVLAGLLVGASLALAGAVLQTVLRNPLADPFVLGLSG